MYECVCGFIKVLLLPFDNFIILARLVSSVRSLNRVRYRLYFHSYE